jgi:hypothetical protein
VLAVATAAVSATCPSPADAHGPIAPIATSYVARVSARPAGIREAKVVDGDQRLWMRASAGATVLVLDYRGAPYLRFSPAGVAVNTNSAMYYYNQTPTEVPPSNLGPSSPPKWSAASNGDAYSWHDGRLHALTAVAIAPGAAYVGRWSIPVRVDGRTAAIAGGLWHAEDPSIVWLWPIIVLVVCVLAARRVNRPELDLRLARLLSGAALAAIAVASIGRGLHGRPTVSLFQLITLAATLAFVAWVAWQLVVRRAGYMTLFVVAFVAIWEGINLIPTLFNGFVLAATPAFVTRVACVACLGCGIALLIVPARLIGDADLDEDDEVIDDEDSLLW